MARIRPTPAQAPDETIDRPATLTVHYQDADGNTQTVEVQRGAEIAHVPGGALTLNWGGDGGLLSSTFGATVLDTPEPETKAAPTGRFLVLDLSALNYAEAASAVERIGKREGVLTALVGGEMPSKARDMGTLMLLLERLAPLASDRLGAVKSALGEKLGAEQEIKIGDRALTGRKSLGKNPRYPWTVVPAIQRRMLEE